MKRENIHLTTQFLSTCSATTVIGAGLASTNLRITAFGDVDRSAIHGSASAFTNIIA